MGQPPVEVVNATTSVVSDARGDIETTGTEPLGLFEADTRFLSRWVLSIDGQRPTLLSNDVPRYFEAEFLLVPEEAAGGSRLRVTRNRTLSQGLRETVLLSHQGDTPVEVTVRVDADADFAVRSEAGGAPAHHGIAYRRIERDTLILGLDGDGSHRQTAISASAPAELDQNGLTFRVHLEPRRDWSVELLVSLADGTASAARR
ncbi:hypothetical protein GCM10023322_35030 [Rugosimonospora acidiphila]|uniref:Putative glycogen debranching enzyme N-terminal domain-containing protein n=1 Tax=Rugosimonospora acidiphila TaxID=556531 RepID=A0ABP9RWC0_9ACTN